MKHPILNMATSEVEYWTQVIPENIPDACASRMPCLEVSIACPGLTPCFPLTAGAGYAGWRFCNN